MHCSPMKKPSSISREGVLMSAHGAVIPKTVFSFGHKMKHLKRIVNPTRVGPPRVGNYYYRLLRDSLHYCSGYERRVFHEGGNREIYYLNEACFLELILSFSCKDGPEKGCRLLWHCRGYRGDHLSSISLTFARRASGATGLVMKFTCFSGIPFFRMISEL